jgi:hypothetical protein
MSLAALQGYGDSEEEEEPQEVAPQPRVSLVALLAPPAHAPPKRTVGIGLADLLKSTALPTAKGGARAEAVARPAASRPDEREALPPGFFDEDAEDVRMPLPESAAPSAGIHGLLSLLPPPTRGRGVAPAPASTAPALATGGDHLAAVAAKRARAGDDDEQEPKRTLAWSAAPLLPGIALPGMGAESDDDDDDDDDADSRAIAPMSGRAHAGLIAPGPANAAFSREGCGFGGDDDDVTAPYPGGDDDDDEGVTAPYPGGDDNGDARARPQSYRPPAQQQHGAVPLELLSRAERRALSDAHGAVGGCAMSTVDQGHLFHSFRQVAADVVVPRPAADVSVEGRVFNRTTGVAELAAKPTGQHKRKNQINQLAHQYQQHAGELEQRGRKGLKSKAETYGRYGW